MRLINAAKLIRWRQVEFEVFPEYRVPERYAILSHRWVDGQEVSLQELTSRDGKVFWDATQKSGYYKLERAAAAAVDYRCDWLWCDTCCIDKTSSAELTEAINSMFRWYRDSFLCFAVLTDIDPTQKGQFTQSVWFTRAWTLQELIAPTKLIFFDNTWDKMGTKHELADAIVTRTRIDKDVLIGQKRLDRINVAQKMSWAADREAGIVEDIAYSLLGIFDVNMPMLYGEGRKAFVRLQEEIMQRNADQSIFIWFPNEPQTPSGHGRQVKNLFASSPADFRQCDRLQQQNQRKKAFGINNLGLDIELTLRPVALDTYLAYLAVESGGPNYLASLTLEIDPETGYLCRSGSSLKTILLEKAGPQIQQTKRVTILRAASSRQQHSTNSLFGFHLINPRNSLHLINDWDPVNDWDLGKWDLGLSSDLYRFVIPSGVAASIAMLKLFLTRNIVLLIQLGFDFDFNPCCHISKFVLDFSERFGRRSKLEEEDNDPRFNWLYSIPQSKWAPGLKHEHTEADDPITTRRYWICKSIDRQDFSATIPTSLTKPHTNLSVRFSVLPQSNREWAFEIDTPSTLHALPHEHGVSIVNVKAEAAQEALRRHTPGPDDPSAFQRRSTIHHDPTAGLRRSFLSPGSNTRSDTSSM